MNVPKLRFKEFDGEWEDNSLAELATFSKGKGISKDNLSTDGKPCILYGELYTKYKEVASTIYSRTNIESSNLIKSEKFDVLIPSSGETAKDIACSTCIIQEDVLIGGDLNILRFGKEIDGRFISYQINGIKKLELSKYAQGATVVHLYSQGIKKLYLKIPTIEEQKKISELLLLLDKKIKLHQQKIDLLKEQKKGFMQKIFNQELRFKDENGQEFPKWNKKKLATIVEYYNGKTNESNIEEDGKYNLINLNSISIDGKLKDTHKKTNKPTFLLNQHDLVMILSDVGVGDLLGRVSLIPEANKYILNQRVGALRVINNEEILPTYLYYYINNNQSYFKLMGQGMSQLNLNKDDVLGLLVSIPNLKEQLKISSLLTALDKKIDLEIVKIGKLKTKKQAFMQQMFI